MRAPLTSRGPPNHKPPTASRMEILDGTTQ